MSLPPEERQIDLVGYLKYLSAAVVTVALTNPIELIKSRIQTSPEHIVRQSITEPYLSIRQTTGRIVRQEGGVQALFKGAGYFILRTIPANIGVFTVKELIHRKLTRYVQYGNHSQMRSAVGQHYFLVNSIIGGFAGFIIQVLIYPFEYFRVVVSNQIKQQSNSGIIACVKEAMHQRGLAGMFNGVSMNLIYMTSARGVYFGMFDSFKGRMKNDYYKFLWSYVSISTALLVNYPLDTVRKRVIIGSNRYKNGRACLRQIVEKESFAALFSGWRTVGIQSITFSTLLFIYDNMFTEIFRNRK